MLDKLKKTQPMLSEIFEKAIISKTFSNSTLFCGPKYSSKMTAAIEVAKALSCTSDKLGESCTCKTCNLYDKYIMQNMVIVSNRDHENRINAAITSYLASRSDYAKDFLIKTVRVLLLSYHNGIYIDKNKKLFENAYIVSELVNEFAQNKEALKARETSRFIKSLREGLKPLLTVSKKNMTNLSVDAVRALQIWLSNTLVNEKVRVVVIEAIEKANESVKNSLLKILEEPNENVYFILISENPSRIMQTILSRVRKYTFSTINIERQRDLLLPLNLDSNIDTFEKFILSSSGMKIDEIDSTIGYLFSSFNTKRYINSEELASFINILDSGTNDEYIINSFINKINESYTNNSISAFEAKQIVNDISEAINNQRIFNLPKKNMYENIYRKMMERVDA